MDKYVEAALLAARDRTVAGREYARDKILELAPQLQRFQGVFDDATAALAALDEALGLNIATPHISLNIATPDGCCPKD